MLSFAVPRAGVEPARPYGHMALNHACLPIPAPGQLPFYKYKMEWKSFANIKISLKNHTSF